ncbi:unnamed protein product [Schistosoma mansoni]|uniref:Smp_201320 n=1 Tax=Schistosoma mansoni TaxID=6183 RepID=G4LV62_SCHMA|nr:unnamed protein product [Schistosoma mansoni]|eukprot:XP_018645163.1 unnamed protein product [Schistosoma mansoni]
MNITSENTVSNLQLTTSVKSLILLVHSFYDHRSAAVVHWIQKMFSRSMHQRAKKVSSVIYSSFLSSEVQTKSVVR